MRTADGVPPRNAEVRSGGALLSPPIAVSVLRDDLLSADEVASVLRLPSPCTYYLAAMVRDSVLLAVSTDDEVRYPAFQFDPTHHRIRPEAAQRNRELLAGADPLRAVEWWYEDRGPSARLSELPRPHLPSEH